MECLKCLIMGKLTNARSNDLKQAITNFYLKMTL